MSAVSGRSRDGGSHSVQICEQVHNTAPDEVRQRSLACETCSKDNMVLVAAETAVAGQIDFETVV